MSKKTILSAKLDYLIDYAKKEYSKSSGLHLNSSDWKSFITEGTPQFYSFLINGTIKFYTKSSISGEKYEQLLKLVDYKKLEAPLLLLFLIGYDDRTIADFVALLLAHGEAKIFCPCEAFQFWGPHYNLTRIKSAYGAGETRPPDKRDPKRENLVCKHLWVILDNYRGLIQKFSVGLLPYYKRMFGLTSPTGIERLQKSLGQEGFKKVIEQAVIDLNKIKNAELITKFKSLTDNKLNEVMKPDRKVELVPDYETIDKAETTPKAEPKQQKPEQKSEPKIEPKPQDEPEENEDVTPNDMDKLMNKDKKDKEEEELL